MWESSLYRARALKGKQCKQRGWKHTRIAQSRDEIVPQCTKTTKHVPTIMAEGRNKYIKDPIRDNIFEQIPESEVSQWISLAFFVPKNGGRGIRLVTDYKQLKLYVLHPVQPSRLLLRSQWK